MRPVLILLLAAASAAAEFRAGVATAKITPDTPVWLSGFAARTSPAERVAQDLWAKVLVLEDSRASRFVLVTADLLGWTREVTDAIAARAQSKYKLERRQILFNASHTHSGPSIWPRLHVARGSGPDVDRQMKAYADGLIDKVDGAIATAISSIAPVRLEYTHAEAGFATNRRAEQLAAVRPGEHFPAPVDPFVPVLRAVTAGGKTLAVVFGYACHNTVLTAESNEVSADYAGYAQQELERIYPGATALFVLLCAGDQRPAPRGKRELAEEHGRKLAAAVAVALKTGGKQIDGELRSAYDVTSIPFQAHGREVYLAESQSADIFLARRGRLMLEAYDQGHPVRSTPYPVQAVRIGNAPAWIALGGEVVIDYHLRLAAEYGADRVVTLGYSNDVMGYIPTVRVQREGGYEAGDSMMYFSQPGWFTEEVEDTVLSAARRMLAAVGVTKRTD